MEYANMQPGIFLSRPNRFIAHVQIGGSEEIVHVKTPAAAGSCFRKGPGCCVRNPRIPPVKPATT